MGGAKLVERGGGNPVATAFGVTIATEGEGAESPVETDFNCASDNYTESLRLAACEHIRSTQVWKDASSDTAFSTKFINRPGRSRPITRRIVVDEDNASRLHARPKELQTLTDRLIYVAINRDESKPIVTHFLGN